TCHARITDKRARGRGRLVLAQQQFAQASRNPRSTQIEVPQEGGTRVSRVPQRTASWVAARSVDRLSTRGNGPAASVPTPRQKTRCGSRSLLPGACSRGGPRHPRRSEEHTSELQSRENLVCRLLLEKKKKTVRASL